MRVLVCLSLFLVWWIVLYLVFANLGDFYSDTAPMAFLGAIPSTIVSIYVVRHYRRGVVQ